MKRMFLVIIGLLIGASAFSSDGIKVELQFFTQTYRLNEPVPVLVNVVNQSEEPFAFDVSSLIYETFFFDIKTPRNEEIQISDVFQIEMENNYSAGEDYRKIVLQSGESFSKQIDITQWFDIKETGYYYIRGVFYPNPDIRRHPLKSIFYKILIKPPVAVESDISETEQMRLSRLETLKKMPPYEAIVDMIDAKMKKDWERFLAHIDAEKLIAAFQNYYSEYQNARTGRYRLDVIQRFKNYLTVHWQDRILSYEVLETVIKRDRATKQDTATVVCDVEYKVRKYSYVLRYEFVLYKNHEDQWLVYDYTSTKVR